MDRTKLIELMMEHKTKFLSRTGLVRREIQKDIDRYIKHREIILISGVRRGGKSSLMKLICDDLISDFNVPASNVLYLNFDDERFIEFSVKDFEALYEIFVEMENPKGKKYFFLDEIQNIAGWEKWVNRLYEFENIKIFVTGSNASMLGSEISAALTGRNRQIINWPFSFREFLTLKKHPVDTKDFYPREEKATVRRLFREYLELGGFPEVLKINDTSLLEQYFKDMLYRDMIARYSIRNIREIKELTLFLASNIGSIQSYENLKNLIGVKSPNTVKNYLEALENIFLFFSIDLFDYSIKRQIYNPSKIYSVDTALNNSISFKFSQNLGRIYENIVFLELKRKDKDVFYWKSKKGREVDFIIKKGLKVQEAIQVAVSIADKKVKEREIKALIDAKKEINPERFAILTDDEEGTYSIEGIEVRIIPLWKWLVTTS